MVRRHQLDGVYKAVQFLWLKVKQLIVWLIIFFVSFGALTLRDLDNITVMLNGHIFSHAIFERQSLRPSVLINN